MVIEMKEYSISRYISSKSFYFKISVFLVAGIMMIGQGARMIFQGIFYKESIYKPNSFDIFFDWFTLLIFGLIIFILTLRYFYVVISKQKYLNL